VATVVEAHTHPPFGYRMNQLRSQGSPKRWSLVLSKQRRHDGPRGVKIIVTTLRGGGESRSPNHTTTQERACPSSQHEVTISVSALLKLSRWCQRRLDDQSGDVVWASPTTLPPPVPLRATQATSTQEVLRPQLWASLLPENRRRLSQIMARVIARHHLPREQEVPDD
jgi:hypothetical protein